MRVGRSALVPIGVHALPLVTEGAHLLDTILCLSAQLLAGLGGIGVTLSDVAGAAGVNHIMQTINCFDFITSRKSVLICHFILSIQPSTLQV